MSLFGYPFHLFYDNPLGYYSNYFWKLMLVTLSRQIASVFDLFLIYEKLHILSIYSCHHILLCFCIFQYSFLLSAAGIILACERSIIKYLALVYIYIPLVRQVDGVDDIYSSLKTQKQDNKIILF